MRVHKLTPKGRPAGGTGADCDLTQPKPYAITNGPDWVQVACGPYRMTLLRAELEALLAAHDAHCAKMEGLLKALRA